MITRSCAPTCRVSGDRESHRSEATSPERLLSADNLGQVAAAPRARCRGCRILRSCISTLRLPPSLACERSRIPRPSRSSPLMAAAPPVPAPAETPAVPRGACSCRCLWRKIPPPPRAGSRCRHVGGSCRCGSRSLAPVVVRRDLAAVRVEQGAAGVEFSARVYRHCGSPRHCHAKEVCFAVRRDRALLRRAAQRQRLRGL